MFGVYDKNSMSFHGLGDTPDEAMDDALDSVFSMSDVLVEADGGVVRFAVELESIPVTKRLYDAIDETGGEFPWEIVGGTADLV